MQPPRFESSRDTVQAELEAALKSSVFANSERLRRFLRFLVERTLAGQTDLKEYTIGLEVFDRDPSYDPRVDSTVRVHAKKLRDLLREYYLSEGKAATVRIEIPKGTYVPVFTERLAATSVSGATRPPPHFWLAAAAIAVAALGLLGGIALMLRLWRPAPPVFQQLTFRRGMISSARFGPDRKTVVYSAAWEGKPLDLFATRPETPDSRPLDIPNGHLLTIGPAGEVAVAVRAEYRAFFQFAGTLARASLSGGAPREMMSDVVAADWSPDASQLAVVRETGGRNRLESPLGRVLFEGPPSAWIGDVRFSPDGNRIAFLVHPLRGDNLGSLYVSDLGGQVKKLGDEWPGIQGVAWPPGGREIWFAAAETNSGNTLYAMDPSGRKRIIWRGADTVMLHDISKDGRVLLSLDNVRLHVMASLPGENRERELSWLDAGCSCGLSLDGKTLLIGESGVGGGPRMSVYLRRMDGSPAVRLGDGVPIALSPDQAWVLAYRHDSPQRPLFLPTGAGDTRPVAIGNIRFVERGSWFPDSRRVVLIGREPNRPPRSYVVSIDGGSPQPITPEGTSGVVLSPNGETLLVRDRLGVWLLYGIAGNDMVPARGLDPDLAPVAWSNNPAVVYARSGDIPTHVYRVNLQSGAREPWRDLMPTDKSGAMSLQHIQVTPAGDAYAYTYFQFDARLFVVDGLR